MRGVVSFFELNISKTKVEIIGELVKVVFSKNIKIATAAARRRDFHIFTKSPP